MTDETQKVEKGQTVSAKVERKMNLGNYENVTVSLHYSSGTLGEDDNVEEKAEELARMATRGVHKELHKIKNGDFDELAGQDEQTRRDEEFDELEQQAKQEREKRQNQQ